MKKVFLVKEENKNQAETKLKEDDAVSRGSINFTLASNLGMGEDGYFCIVDGTKEAVEKAEELLDDLGEVYEDKEKVVEKQKEKEDSATEALGNILG